MKVVHIVSGLEVGDVQMMPARSVTSFDRKRVEAILVSLSDLLDASENRGPG